MKIWQKQGNMLHLKFHKLLNEWSLDRVISRFSQKIAKNDKKRVFSGEIMKNIENPDDKAAFSGL